MKKNTDFNPTKTAFQKFAASFVVIVGLVVFLSTANTITGRAVGGTGDVRILDIAVAIWGILIMGVGLWMWHHKRFNESIFDK